MAVVILGITLSQIYDLGLTLGQEGENTQLLVDKMYYLRKDAEYAFWEAAKPDLSTRLKTLDNWVNTTEMNQTTIAKAVWKGNTHTALQVFNDITVPSGCYPGCNQAIGGQIRRNMDECLTVSGDRSGIEAVGASFYLENPTASSIFIASGEDRVCPG